MGAIVDPGPVDRSVLYDQDNHISSAIWDGQVTAMREIADIAESLSTDQMGFQYRQSVDEIKNTALNSWVDVVDDFKRSKRRIATKRKREDDPTLNKEVDLMSGCTEPWRALYKMPLFYEV